MSFAYLIPLLPMINFYHLEEVMRDGIEFYLIISLPLFNLASSACYQYHIIYNKSWA